MNVEIHISNLVFLEGTRVVPVLEASRTIITATRSENDAQDEESNDDEHLYARQPEFDVSLAWSADVLRRSEQVR